MALKDASPPETYINQLVALTPLVFSETVRRPMCWTAAEAKMKAQPLQYISQAFVDDEEASLFLHDLIECFDCRAYLSNA